MNLKNVAPKDLDADSAHVALYFLVVRQHDRNSIPRLACAQAILEYSNYLHDILLLLERRFVVGIFGSGHRGGFGRSWLWTLVRLLQPSRKETSRNSGHDYRRHRRRCATHLGEDRGESEHGKQAAGHLRMSVGGFWILWAYTGRRYEV